MHVIGIVGGVASGKSTVSAMLRELGAVVLNADRAGHEVLRDPEVIAAIMKRWGIDAIDANGEVDRAAVAARVFGDVANADVERRFLESITHPRIRSRLEEEIAEAERQGEVAVILDAPLLFEGGWDDACDSIVFVDAPLEDRRKRVGERGWSPEELEHRERWQIPLEEKKARSGVVIENAGSLEQTLDQVTRFWRRQVEGTLVE